MCSNTETFMRRLLIAGSLLTALTVLAVATSEAQPPEGKNGKKGPPGDQNGPPGGPPRFQLGHVLPPFVREELELTAEQEEQIEALEKQVKAKLEKILTAEQRKKLKSIRPPGPPPGGPEGPNGGPNGRPEDRGGREGEPPPKKKRQEQPGDQEAAAGGIQWFTTWKHGKAEAARTGRPILLLSAAPHCAGVSGIW
jgi:Spy/CpxP family protein refolding chaperone